MGLTNVVLSNTIYGTAEVAEAISTPLVRQLPGAGKELPPKGLPHAEGAAPGAAQNMRGTVTRLGGVLPGQTNLFALCCCTGIFIL